MAHDLNVTPWPFDDDSAEEIVAIDVVEHLDSFISFFDECHRILGPGGKVAVRVPRWDSINVAIDPTHKRGYHPESFDYLDPETRWGSQYGTSYTSRGWRKMAVMMDSENIMAKMEVRK